MKPKGYFIFHLNLAFSSVDKSAWSSIIEKCYWPILDIISDLNVPIGIELTGWTLNNIHKSCPEWTDKFKQLLNDGKCELIGSGYCQIIAPLVPYEVNYHNQLIGLDVYKNILGISPKIALVNEMAYSDSVIDLLSDAGYSGFIMDKDNIQLALNMENAHISQMPSIAKGIGKSKLPILWADSILFQKLQHVSHGNISIDDYLNFIKKRLSEKNFLLPLYSNDAETFDFRPGRFKEESDEINPNEWLIIRKVIKKLSHDLDFEFISPSEAILIQNNKKKLNASSLTTAGYPVPVKKQPKYNIARWAVTGRDDTWLNTICYRIYEKIRDSKYSSNDNWKMLCEFWSSDLRTHLTETRWLETKARLSNVLQKFDLDDSLVLKDEPTTLLSNKLELQKITGFDCRVFGDGIYLELKNENFNLVLNMRRGMAIESLSFTTHKGKPCIGTLKHGHLSSIEQGADFYSGGMVIDLPLLRTKVTDLHPVNPEFHLLENGNLLIISSIISEIGPITKKIELFRSSEQIAVTYNLSQVKRSISSVKLANITLSSDFSKSLTSYSCRVGGNEDRVFDIAGRISQSQSASRYVSSSRGFSSTSGKVSLNFNKSKLHFSWNNSDCTPLCFIDHDGDFSRLSFSICEFDESSKESERYGDFKVILSPLEIIK